MPSKKRKRSAAQDADTACHVRRASTFRESSAPTTLCIQSPKNAGRFQFAQAVGLTKEPAFATQCVGCGKCEQHCPQEIPIREKLKEADKALRPLHYKIGIAVARKYMYRKSKKKSLPESKLLPKANLRLYSKTYTRLIPIKTIWDIRNIAFFYGCNDFQDSI